MYAEKRRPAAYDDAYKYFFEKKKKKKTKGFLLGCCVAPRKCALLIHSA
jgi:hypothetical protein